MMSTSPPAKSYDTPSKMVSNNQLLCFPIHNDLTESPISLTFHRMVHRQKPKKLKQKWTFNI